MSFLKRTSEVIFLLIPLICQAIASLPDFCESNQLKSAFNIDRDLYFVGFKNNTNLIWKYDIRSNDVFVDYKMRAFVQKLGFDVKSPILGFKFTEVYECSKSMNTCRDKKYKFEGFDNCNKNNSTFHYCRNQTQLQDITFLIGSDKQSKANQSYRALRLKNSDFELIPDRDMPFGWPSSSSLNKKTFIQKDSDKDMLMGIVYNRNRYELAMIVKSKGKLNLKVSTLDTHQWFQNWKTFPNVPNKQFVGFIEKDAKIFAITAFDDFVFSYEAYGQNNSEKKLQKQNFKFENLFNCILESDDSSEDVILKVGVNSSEDKDIVKGTNSPMPETNPMIFVIIPMFTLVTVLAIYIVYLMLCRPYADHNKTALKRVLNK